MSSQLKTTLLELKSTPPNYLELTQIMLEHLGSPDPELRDQLIYRRLAGWLFESVLSEAETKDVLDTLQDDEHLFYKLGEAGTDSVLLRSFSVLLINFNLPRSQEVESITFTPVFTESSKFLIGRKPYRAMLCLLYDERLEGKLAPR